MGCGISRLDRHSGGEAHHHDLTSSCESNDEQINNNNNNVKERGMYEASEEDDMKKEMKERSGRVEKVKESRKEEQRAHAGKKGHQSYGPDFVEDRRRQTRHFDDDEQMLSDSDREDSFLNCPRSPSFRDYCIDDFGVHMDHAENREMNKSETSVESRNTNKEISEADEELVKKEGKGRSSGIRGVLSKGKQSRITSYLSVSSWHHKNNPLSPSQQNSQKLVAGNKLIESTRINN